MSKSLTQLSALSAPQDFIAEGFLRRFYRRRSRILLFASLVAVGASLMLLVTAGGGLLKLMGETRAVLSNSAEQEMSLPELIRREQNLVAQRKHLDTPSVTGSTSTAQSTTISEKAAMADAPKITVAPDTAQTSKAAETGSRLAPDATGERDATQPPVKSDPSLKETIEKGDRYLRRGQYTVARYIFEEAYRAGEIYGALGMAKSYDADYLKSIGLKNKGDPRKSQIWYHRATELTKKRLNFGRN